MVRAVLFLLACYTAVVGSLVVITITVMISDVVTAPGLARDVVAALGGHLVAVASSLWLRRSTSPRSAASSIRPDQ